MASQKHLSTLRKVSKPVKFTGEDDGEPFEVNVIVRKLIDEDHEACLRSADAAKARAMIDRGNRESELWQSAYGTALTFGDDPAMLAEYLSHFHIAKVAPVLQAEIAGDEKGEWGKDGYLDGLLDAWRGTAAGDLGLQLAYAAKDDDPDTIDPALAAMIPEAVRVFEEISRYEAAVEQKLDAERAKFVREHSDEDLEALRLKVVDTFLEKRANTVWVRAFERARIYYATRRADDISALYFKDIRQVIETDPGFLNDILLAYESISAEGVEGKDSPDPQSSSPLSGSSGEEETSESSGPTAASA